MVSATIEFYAADPQEITAVFQLDDFDLWFEKLSAFAVADFSLHLRIPDDLDRLFWSCRQVGLQIADKLEHLIARQIWQDDEGSASLELIAEELKALGDQDDSTLQSIVELWTSEFSDARESTEQALVSLRNVCSYAKANGPPKPPPLKPRSP